MKITTAIPDKDLVSGTKIFAKVKGHSYWPARIDLLPDELMCKNQYRVIFYGTNESALVRKDKMVLYNEESKQNYGQPKKLKNFNLALSEIESAKENNIEIIHKDIQSNLKLKKKNRMSLPQMNISKSSLDEQHGSDTELLDRKRTRNKVLLERKNQSFKRQKTNHKSLDSSTEHISLENDNVELNFESETAHIIGELNTKQNDANIQNQIEEITRIDSLNQSPESNDEDYGNVSLKQANDHFENVVNDTLPSFNETPEKEQQENVVIKSVSPKRRFLSDESKGKSSMNKKRKALANIENNQILDLSNRSPIKESTIPAEIF